MPELSKGPGFYKDNGLRSVRCSAKYAGAGHDPDKRKVILLIGNFDRACLDLGQNNLQKKRNAAQAGDANPIEYSFQRFSSGTSFFG